MPLGARATDMLIFLVESGGRLLAKQELLAKVWPGLDVEEGNLAVQVSTLRRHLGSDCIATIPGLGYRFAMTVESIDEVQTPTAGTAVFRPQTKEAAVMYLGALEWHPEQRLALIDGSPADLGSRAVELLAVLIAERHRVVLKQELLERVWPGLVVEENNLPVHVSALRKLLGQGAVITIPGRGYRFGLDSSQSEVPPPRPVPAERSRQTNLAGSAEALIGRAADIDSLAELLTMHRVVSIVGAGGMGKTRVAQAVAGSIVDRFAQGAWWVDLGALTEANAIAPAIAAAARVQLGPGDSAVQLASTLEARQILLVLDNCEHLVDAVSQIAATLLETADGLRILATSQEPLRLRAEQVFRLEALDVPLPGASLDEARRSGALSLLERRAQAVSRRFVLTEAVLPAASELCRQLDGIPLAIEMAAARLPQLGPRALLSALGERLTWLKSGIRTAPARQQTLRAMLDWSHSLLNANEQAVLRRLGVFAGSFPLEAARRVGSSPSVDEWVLDEALAALVERSLVQVSNDDPPRYRLLETTRLYAREQLELHGEAESAALAHMMLMADTGSEVEEAYWVQPDEYWLSRYLPEYDDLQAAFVRACAMQDVSCVARTLDALHRMDELQDLHTAIAPRVAAAQRLIGCGLADADAGLRIRLVIAATFLMQKTLEGVSKFQAAEEAAVLARRLGDRRRLYRALFAIVVHATVAGDEAAMAAALEEANAMEDPTWPPRLLWSGALNLTFHFAMRSDTEGVMRSTRAELAYARRAGSPYQMASARINLAEATSMSGDKQEAVRLGYEVIAEAKALGRPENLAMGIANLCGALIASGNLRAAGELAPEAIALAWRHGRIGYLLDHLSSFAAQSGRFEVAQQLIGFTDAWWTRMQYRREGNEAAAVAHAMALSESALGTVEASKCRDLGARLDEAAVEQVARACVEAVSAAVSRSGSAGR